MTVPFKCDALGVTCDNRRFYWGGFLRHRAYAVEFLRGTPHVPCAMQRSCHSWPMLCLSARPSRKLPGACTSAQCGSGPEGRRAPCTAIRTTTCSARYPPVCTAAAEGPELQATCRCTCMWGRSLGLGVLRRLALRWYCWKGGSRERCHMRWGRRSGACEGAELHWQAPPGVIRAMRRCGERSWCVSTALMKPRGYFLSRTPSYGIPLR